MTIRRTLLKRLPRSLLCRGGGVRRAQSVLEGEIMTRVAYATAGPVASLAVALNCFCVPIQCVTGVELIDVLAYMSPSMDLMGRVGFYEKLCDLRDVPNLPPVSGLVGPFGAEGSKVNDLEIRKAERWSTLSIRAWWRGRAEKDVFPTKGLTPGHKINLWLVDVLEDVSTYFPAIARVFKLCPEISAGMSNDEATAWLLWMVSAYPIIGCLAFVFVERYSRDSGKLKDFTTVIKGSGLQSEPWGSLIVETSTLSGRGVAIPAEVDDVRFRIDEEVFLKEKGVVADEALLREAIRAVVRDELVTHPVWEDRDKYWSRRWLFTRAGAHSQYAEESWFGERLDLPERPTRREFSEACEDNLVAYGTPTVEAGLSWKMEHGKTRAIYSCDTRSYFTFDYLLKPVEACWANKHVLLDPGGTTQSSLYERLRDAGRYKFMLDFDDFNSQHTLRAMEICVEEACKGAPPDVLAWAKESWSNMYVHWGLGSEVRRDKMVGTLPSGHRATTFINTILNAAYCRLVAGDLYREVKAWHTGDDVIMAGREEMISKLAVAFDQSPFRTNRSKQSVGSRCGEFLRICIGAKEARGYVARAIASLVSGNWVSETRLSKRAYTETLLRGAWTCAARGGEPRIGAALTTSLRHWVPELSFWAYALCTHSISLEGTPIRAGRDTQTIKVLRVEGGLMIPQRVEAKYTFATDQFFANHVDFKLLEAAEVSPSTVRSAMIRSSYKPRTFKEQLVMGVVETVTSGIPVCSSRMIEHYAERSGKGEVEALQILRNMYREVDWRKLVASVRGGDSSGMSVQGKMEWPVISDYTTTFSDCMRARSKLTRPAHYLNPYPIKA